VTERDLWVRFKLAATQMGMVPERYENAATFGTFDASVSWNNNTIWVEFKATQYDVLKLSQLRWARARWKHGCTNDMYVIYHHRVETCLQTLEYPLKEGGKLNIEHAMVFPSMGEVLMTIRGRTEKL